MKRERLPLILVGIVGLAMMAAAGFAKTLRPDAPGVRLIGKFRGEPLYYVPAETDTLWLSALPDSFNQVYVDDRRVAYRATDFWARYGLSSDRATLYDGIVRRVMVKRKTVDVASCYVTSRDYGEGEIIFTAVTSDGAAAEGYTYGFGTALVLPDTTVIGGRTYAVRSVGDSTFYGLEHVESVSLPATMEWIGGEAFGGIETLRRVSIGATSLNYCGDNGAPAFPACVEELILGEGMTRIPGHAFANLANISEVRIPAGVRSIGESAFRYCFGLDDLQIEAERLEACGSFDYPAFPTTLRTVEIGEGVRKVPDFMFKDCPGLAAVTLPDGVASVGEYAFSGCSGLLRLSLGEGIGRIPYGMLQGTSLRSLAIRGDVDSVMSQYVAAKPQKAFWLDATAPAGAAELQGTHNYLLPEAEGYGAFRNVERPAGLSRMEMADGIVYIPSEGGEALAADCSYLPEMTTLAVPGEVELEDGTYDVVKTGIYAFAGNRFVTSVDLAESCRPGDYSFSGLTGLRELSLTGTDLSGESLFACCYGLEKVWLGEGVTGMGNRIFENCSALREIWLGDDIEWVGTRVFGGCDGLGKVHISLPEPPDCEEESFEGFPQARCILDVPEEYFPAYQAAVGWQGFRFIGDSAPEVSEGGGVTVRISGGRLEISGADSEETVLVVTSAGILVARGTVGSVQGMELGGPGPIVVVTGGQAWIVGG